MIFPLFQGICFVKMVLETSAMMTSSVSEAGHFETGKLLKIGSAFNLAL